MTVVVGVRAIEMAPVVKLRLPRLRAEDRTVRDQPPKRLAEPFAVGFGEPGKQAGAVRFGVAPRRKFELAFMVFIFIRRKEIDSVL